MYLKENLISLFLHQSITYFFLTRLTATRALTSDLSSLAPFEVAGGFDWVSDMRDCGVLNWKEMTESIFSTQRHGRPGSRNSHIHEDQRPNLAHQSGEDPSGTPCLAFIHNSGGI